MLPDNPRPDEPSWALKKCPFCAESVRAEAIICKHCGSDLRPQRPQISSWYLFLYQLRRLVGIGQVLITMGGCVAIAFTSSGLLLFSIEWFVILLVVQIALFALIAIATPK